MTLLIFTLLLGPLLLALLLRRSLATMYLALAVGFGLALITTLTLTYSWNNGQLLWLREALVTTINLGEGQSWWVVPNALPLFWPMLTTVTLAFVTRLAVTYGWAPTRLDHALLWAMTALLMAAPIISRTAFNLRMEGRYTDYPQAVWFNHIATGIVYLLVAGIVLTAAIRALRGIPAKFPHEMT